MSIKRSFTFIAMLTLLVLVLSLSSVFVTQAEGPARLYVPADYETISRRSTRQARSRQPQQVDILVAPGVYFGQLVIDRPHTTLVGLSGPQHDESGFLSGFAAPVEIRNVGTLYAGNIVFINASHVRVEGFVVSALAAARRSSGQSLPGGTGRASKTRRYWRGS